MTAKQLQNFLMHQVVLNQAINQGKSNESLLAQLKILSTVLIRPKPGVFLFNILAIICSPATHYALIVEVFCCV